MKEFLSINTVLTETLIYSNSKKKVDAVLISHAHLDHYGLTGFIDSGIPIYMSKDTKVLIEVSNIFLPKKMLQNKRLENV